MEHSLNIFRALETELERRQRCALVTVIGAQGSTPRKEGSRMIVGKSGLLEGTIGGGTFEYQVIKAAIPLLAKGGFHRLQFHLTRDLAQCCGGAMEVSVEVFVPARRLVIFGAGHVALELSKVCTPLGFDLHVVDDREDWANKKRFPEGSLHDDFMVFKRGSLQLETDDLCIVMTAEHATDQQIVEALLATTEVRYIGLMGSATKVAKFHQRLKARGISASALKRLHAPVGLDIHAETPYEIALSIASELVAVTRKPL
ncbi:MAG: xanthine dehydrogenase accessory protein XdhC [Planctomycetota bacterium]